MPHAIAALHVGQGTARRERTPRAKHRGQATRDRAGPHSLTTIPSGTVDTTEVDFALPPGTPPGSTVDVTAVLLYRRAWRAVAVTKGWTETTHGDPIEIEVARNDETLTVTGSVVEIPALSPAGLALAALALAAAGWVALRRRRSA